jgi:hypothetical protein
MRLGKPKNIWWVAVSNIFLNYIPLQFVQEERSVKCIKNQTYASHLFIVVTVSYTRNICVHTKGLTQL